MNIRIIGDVHGLIWDYIEIIKGVDKSIQLGDMGFKNQYTFMQKLMLEKEIKSVDHLFVPGNHDDYNHLPSNSLGDFGHKKIGQHKVMWIRGALSIDKKLRTSDVDWWREEELSYNRGQDAINLYNEILPDIVLSHNCPFKILSNLYGTAHKEVTITGQILDTCFEAHQPKMWLFGHHHQDKTFEIGRTTFKCLDELSYVDLEL
tara:strand:- start:17 stop:628 length:612 start_codon:yes stop_codon:yes gene_type:complete